MHSLELGMLAISPVVIARWNEKWKSVTNLDVFLPDIVYPCSLTVSNVLYFKQKMIG